MITFPRVKVLLLCLIWASAIDAGVVCVVASLEEGSILLDGLLYASITLAPVLAFVLFFASLASLAIERWIALVGIVVSLLCWLAGAFLPFPIF